MNPTDFRAMFSEFDATNYPDALVTIWLAQATNEVNPTRWGSDTNYGIALLTAHYLVLARRRALSATAGASPGDIAGPVTAKSVDGVSVSRDAGSVTIEGAGSFNTTDYGVLFWQKARWMGAGGLQINAC